MRKNEYELGSATKQKRRPGGPPGMGGGGEKAKNMKVAIKKLTSYIHKYRALMIIAICFAMFGSILTLVGPGELSNITDEITSGIHKSMSGSGDGINMESIFSIGLTLAIVYGISYLLSILQGLIISTVMQKTAKNLRGDISNKINKLPMGYFSKNSKGDVLSRITNDVDTLGQTMSQSMGTFISSVTLLIGSVIMMAITNVPLTIAAILSTLVGFIFIVKVMRKSKSHLKSQQNN